jgi:hypothetical protein
MKRWDVVILGANAGGILAGALLTKKGFSVLVLEEKAMVGSARRRYQFRRFSNLSELLISRAVIERVYHLLDLPFDNGEFSPRTDLKCQILLPNHRVDMSVDRAVLLDQVKKEFPRDFGLIEAFYSQLQKGNWIHHNIMAIGVEQPLIGRIGRWFVPVYHGLSDRPVSAFLASMKGDKALARFIDVQIKSMSYLFADNLPVSLASHLIGNLVEDEAFTNIMGPQGFMDRVKGEALRGGGKINALESFNTLRIEKDQGEFRVYTKGEGKPILSRVRWRYPLQPIEEAHPHGFSRKKMGRKSQASLAPVFHTLLKPRY